MPLEEQRSLLAIRHVAVSVGRSKRALLKEKRIVEKLPIAKPTRRSSPNPEMLMSPTPMCTEEFTRWELKDP